MALAWSVDRHPFWREESVFPALHYVVPLLLYQATRNALLTIVIVYAWETVEQTAARHGYRHLAGEQWDDSWIGDILMGALPACTFALLDDVYGWREAVTGTAGPPLALRVLLYVAVAVASLFLHRWQPSRTWRPELVVFALAYAGLGLAVFAPFWASHGPGAAIRASTLAWLAGAGLAMAVSVPRMPVDGKTGGAAIRGTSSYIRVFVAGLLLLIAALALKLAALTEAKPLLPPPV